VPDRQHYFWIDALRGWAAIIVLISHVSIFGLYGYEHILAAWPPTRLLWSGHQAVILFFVISGFALYLLLEQMDADSLPWSKFILVRFWRLYPPYLASLLLGLLVLNAPTLFGITVPPGAPVIAHGQLTSNTLIGHLLMLGDFDVRAINPPIWSLVYEARLSLLFPLIYLMAARGGRRMAVAAGVMWIAGILHAAACDLGYLDRRTILGIGFGTLNFAVAFFVGATVARHRRQIAGWLSQRHASAGWALLLSIVVFMYSFHHSWAEWSSRAVLRLADGFSMLASAYFVALAISIPAPAKRGIIGFFGTISYSLYLVHQPVIMAVILLFYGKLAAPVMWLISISASVGMAWLFYLAVERPSKMASRAVRLGSMKYSAPL
jgi:peptidoglycan/LPS O-acetylase OafA/YrhL